MNSGPLCLITGGSSELAQRVAALLLPSSRVVLVTRDPQRVQKLLPDVCCRSWDDLDGNWATEASAVIHLAAVLPGRASWHSFEDVVNGNVGTTLRLVRFCRHHDVTPRFILASTVSVYADHSDSTINESSSLNPLSPYSASKLLAEKIVISAADLQEPNYAILRFSGIYGQHGRNDPVLNLFVRHAVEQGRVSVTSPNSVRDFIYIEDAAQAIVCAMQSASSGVYNIASGVGHTLRDLADAVATEFGGRVVVQDSGEPPTRRIYEIRRAASSLAFTPRFSLREALARMHKGKKA